MPKCLFRTNSFRVKESLKGKLTKEVKTIIMESMGWCFKMMDEDEGDVFKIIMFLNCWQYKRL